VSGRDRAGPGRGGWWAGRPKRWFDCVLAGLGLLLLAPVLGLIALAIRFTMGPPVIFVQERPGRDGRGFALYKFRTMTPAPGEGQAPVPDHARLTRLGRALRRTSLDELPELVNVLKGDMSLVGPRPLLMRYLDRYTPEQFRRHEVRPGITGLAQLNGRDTLPWDERFAFDVWYVDHQSLWLDIRILLETVVKTVLQAGVRQPGEGPVGEFEGSGRRADPGATR
jgi:lipopolysaccharide/colanic/teichoic acid biosynthesis glycosyltransferase